MRRVFHVRANGKTPHWLVTSGEFSTDLSGRLLRGETLCDLSERAHDRERTRRVERLAGRHPETQGLDSTDLNGAGGDVGALLGERERRAVRGDGPRSPTLARVLAAVDPASDEARRGNLPRVVPRLGGGPGADEEGDASHPLAEVSHSLARLGVEVENLRPAQRGIVAHVDLLSCHCIHLYQRGKGFW